MAIVMQTHFHDSDPYVVADWAIEISVSTAGRTNADIQVNGFVSDGAGFYNMRFARGELLNS